MSISRDPRARAEAAEEEKQFDERVVHVDRVARVVKGGRRFRFRALVVVGDRKQRVGIGSAKGADVTAAIAKAAEKAKKAMINITLYKGTVPHEVTAKVGGSSILIMPASAGTGLIAGGVVRTVLEVAGVNNVLSKSLGSSNKTNTAYATIEALNKLVPAKKWITNQDQNSRKSKVESSKSEKSEAHNSEDKTAAIDSKTSAKKEVEKTPHTKKDEPVKAKPVKKVTKK